MVIILALFIIGIYIYLSRKKAKNAPMDAEKHRIEIDFICDDGSFRIEGVKESFQISKNDRFSFLVEDGKIVSFVDKSVTDEKISYGGLEYGDY